jgi:catechol 2,3-dioxygenase-like lactoylglutathione lyase family enzyme
MTADNYKPPKLFRVILPVSDIEKAAHFYSLLLGMPGKRVSAGRHYFDCGGTILACFDPKADGDDFTLGPNPDHVYFAVDNLDEKFDLARGMLGVTPEDEIKVQPWGERSFYFKDPFGNKICFVDEKTKFTGQK